MRNNEQMDLGHDQADFTRPEKRAVWLLVLQHFSGSWTARSIEFGIFLALIDVFPNSLLPASVYGLCTAATAVCFSNLVGCSYDGPGETPS
jgi:iron-regulated transporter 1